MTDFLGAAVLAQILATDDRRSHDEQWHNNEDLFTPPVLWDLTWQDENVWAGWQTPWWPSMSCLGVGRDNLTETGLIVAPGGWADPWTWSGASSRLAFVGITRDAAGSALGTCTVRCIRTSTDEMVSKVTSDANGAYIATTPYSDAHFLVIHNAAGDRAGASVNTILPA